MLMVSLNDFLFICYRCYHKLDEVCSDQNCYCYKKSIAERNTLVDFFNQKGDIKEGNCVGNSRLHLTWEPISQEDISL